MMVGWCLRPARNVTFEVVYGEDGRLRLAGHTGGLCGLGAQEHVQRLGSGLERHSVLCLRQ